MQGVQAQQRRWAAQHVVMLAQGIDVRTVSDVLGHADVSTTLRAYVHSTEGATRRAADTMGLALG